MSLLVLLWIAYFSLHSILALDSVKKIARSSLGSAYRYYRLFFNCISGLGFLCIGWYQLRLPSPQLVHAPNWVFYIAWPIMLAGFILVYLAFKSYNTKEFIGIEQLEFSEAPIQALNTSGLNHYMRHPLYTGTLIAVLGYCLIRLDMVSLITAGIWLAYIIIGSHLEEKKLVRILSLIHI